ncbi:uncharacterized protein E6C27_scaffold133G00730 [Cucumis melo var. makuwa]|uniref:Integrase catalytic domain-containing protein n=1 Tax=Cucumis melo var. makuwa TaxID=1194695 RepID=A0A5A7U2P4_CUCMM|nr:uncharacterized protein E6C27_scaffold133G00730 [Cucumis melo var. makuwa]
MNKKAMVALLGQVTEMNKLLQSMVFSMNLTPIPTMLVGEIIPTLVGEGRAKKIKDDRVVRVIIVVKHLAIDKDNIKTDHTIQHLNNNKLSALLHPPPHLWKLFFAKLRQLADDFIGKPSGSLPSNTKIPDQVGGSRKEKCQAVTLRSERIFIYDPNPEHRNSISRPNAKNATPSEMKNVAKRLIRMNDYEVVALTQATSDFFKKGVRKKMTNRGSFTVPCSIGGMDLGRALCRALIDVYQGELTMQLNDQKVTFNVVNAMKFPSDAKNYNKIKFLGWDYCEEEVFAKLFSLEEFFEDENPQDILEEVNVVSDTRKLKPLDLQTKARIVLGHKIFHAGLEVDLAKIDVVSMLPSLFDLKTLRSFLGHAGIYRRFLKVPILITLIGRKPFELMCDASDVVIGAMLGKIGIVARIGIENQVADHLSCLSNAPFQRKKKEITDCFFDKQLFAVEGKELWDCPLIYTSESGQIADSMFLSFWGQDRVESWEHNHTRWNSLLPTFREIPQQSILEIKLFDVLGTDFIGPFSQSGGHLYILLDMDYVSKWVEAISNVKIDVITVSKFLKKNIFSRFGTPRALINDEGSHFINHIITKLLVMYNINHKVATANKPQTNGQVDVCNREIKILEKVVNSSLKDLADHLDSTLLAYCTAYKTPIGMSPYALVFGKACHLPRELECKKLWACKKLNFNNRVQERLDYFSCTSFRNDIFKPLRTPKSIKKRQRHCTISTLVNTIAPWKESITL